MGRKVYVIGVGMTKFEKPGSRQWDYQDMAREAGQKALADAGIPYAEVEQAAVGYCYGESTCGERAVYELGLSGIPVYNVNNNCSTGSTALFMAKQLVEGGLAALCDEVWLVTCDGATQRARLLARGTEPQDAERRIAAQAGLLERLAPAATHVLDTSGDAASTRALVAERYAAALSSSA